MIEKFLFFEDVYRSSCLILLFFAILKLLEVRRGESGLFPVPWGLKEALVIAVALLFLPTALSAALGVAFSGDYRAELSFPITSCTMQIFLLSRVLSGLAIASLVILLFNRFKVLRKDVGFRRASLLQITVWPVIGIGALFIFSVSYNELLARVFKISIPRQYIAFLFDSAEYVYQYILLVFYLVIVTPVVEEVIFRSFFFNTLRKYVNVWGAILLSSLLFALFHFQIATLVPLSFIGVVLAYLYKRSGSILPAIVAHSLNNLLACVLVIIAT